MSRIAKQIRSQVTRLQTEGGYIEFAATSPHDAYLQYEPIRDVRRAILDPQLERFTGSNGALEFKAEAMRSLARDVKVQLYGGEQRIRIWRQLTANEVWAILDVLRAYQ